MKQRQAFRDYRGRCFEPGDLSKVKFEAADLRGADLSALQDLSADALASSNLGGAKLPELEWRGIAHAEKLVSIARPVYLGLLAACLYSWLTLGSTTDVQLLTNTGESSLPIVDIRIPIVGFFTLAPLLLLLFFLFFQVYLQRIWTTLGNLPSIFPDYTSLEKRIDPWLLSRLVRQKPHIPNAGGIHQKLEASVAALLAWWLVPFTLLLFWLRYLPAHDWLGSGFQLTTLLLSIAMALYFRVLAFRTLGNRRNVPGAVVFFLFSAWTALALLFSFATHWSITASSPRYACEDLGDGQDSGVWSFLIRRTHADISNQAVTGRPENYWLIAPQDRAKALKKRGLAGKNLHHLLGINSFLAGSNLSRSQLLGACLIKADLSGARLLKTIMERTTLVDANLRGADFEEAEFIGSENKLLRATLDNANLSDLIADSKTDFSEASLKNVSAHNAALPGAVFSSADLSEANFMQAELDDALFYNATLERSCFNYSTLVNSKFEGAKVSGMDITGADLSGSSITQDQLDSACSDGGTIVPEGKNSRSIPRCDKQEVKTICQVKR